jgi:hypothetical protein
LSTPERHRLEVHELRMQMAIKGTTTSTTNIAISRCRKREDKQSSRNLKRTTEISRGIKRTTKTALYIPSEPKFSHCCPYLIKKEWYIIACVGQKSGLIFSRTSHIVAVQQSLLRACYILTFSNSVPMIPKRPL